MRTRLRKQATVVLDGRILADLAAAAWTPEGPGTTVFEFAHACGRPGTLVDDAGRQQALRVIAILYMGGRIFAAPGEGAARFGVLLRARRRVVPGIYDLDIAQEGFPYLRNVPVAALPPVSARTFGGNLFFMVG